MMKDYSTNKSDGLEESLAADESVAGGGSVPLSPLEAVTRERDDLRDKFLRAQAECANIAKRLSLQHSQTLRHAPMALAKSMLPILDGLERTIKSIDESGRDDPIAEGVRLLRDEFLKAFRANGIQPIEGVGKPFDPELHQALIQDRNTDAPPGTVTVEYEKGYMLHDRVLRPAKVVVSAPKSDHDAGGSRDTVDSNAD